jgi:hypothetical protein
MAKRKKVKTVSRSVVGSIVTAVGDGVPKARVILVDPVERHGRREWRYKVLGANGKTVESSEESFLHRGYCVARARRRWDYPIYVDGVLWDE